MRQIYPFAIQNIICSPNKLKFFKQLFFPLFFDPQVQQCTYTRNAAQNVVISWFCPLPVYYTIYTCLGTSRHLNNDDSPRQVTKSNSLSLCTCVTTLFLFTTHKKNYIIFFPITCGNIFQDGRCNKTRVRPAPLSNIHQQREYIDASSSSLELRANFSFV